MLGDQCGQRYWWRANSAPGVYIAGPSWRCWNVVISIPCSSITVFFQCVDEEEDGEPSSLCFICVSVNFCVGIGGMNVDFYSVEAKWSEAATAKVNLKICVLSAGGYRDRNCGGLVWDDEAASGSGA